MISNPIFAFAVTETLRRRLLDAGATEVTSAPPWMVPAETITPCTAVLELTASSIPLTSGWLAIIQLRCPKARILVLAHEDVPAPIRADFESRTTVMDVAAPSGTIAKFVRKGADAGSPPPPHNSVALTDQEWTDLSRTFMAGGTEFVFLLQDGVILFAAIPDNDTRGWIAETVAGRHVLSLVHPSSHEKVMRNYAARMAGSPDSPLRYEIQVVSPKGDTYPVELIVHRIEFRGRPASVGTLKDIVDRHAWLKIRDRRERELSLMHNVTRHLISGKRLTNSVSRALESILDALDADAGGVFLKQSPRGPYSTLVARKRVQGRSRPWKKCASTPAFHLEQATLEQLRAGRPVRVATCALAAAPGQHFLTAPLLSKKKLVGFLNVMREKGDLFDDDEASLLCSIAGEVALGIENRRLYDDLQRSYTELLDTQKELLRRERLAVIGTMAAHVAHEIRNPVATIMNASGQISKRLELTGIEAELAGIIEEELDRLRRLCDDLVMFSRTPNPAPRPFVVLHFLEEILTDLQKAHFITEAMTTSIHVDPPDLETAQDPDILQNLVRNLVMNGIQSMGSEGTLSLSSTIEHRMFIIDILDSGPGIPPEIIEKIFDPFFSTRPESSGLGLAIVRNYVEEMGGELSVTSSTESGTRVRLSLPLPSTSSHPPSEGL